MQTLFGALSALSLSMALTVHSVPAAHFSTACRAADTTTALEIISLKHMMRAGNSEDSTSITRAGFSFVADTAFAVVSDSTTCATALAAHNHEAGYTSTQLADPASATVYLIRVGNRYVTWNPSFPTGEFSNHAVWDTSFNIVVHHF